MGKRPSSDARATGMLRARPRRRVFHVINALDHGGAETYVLKLISALSRGRETESTLAYTRRGGIADRADGLGVRSLSLSEHLWTFRNPIRSLMIAIRLCLLAREAPRSIVHTHLLEPYVWVCMLAWSFGLPVFRTVVSCRRTASTWMQWLERVLARVTTGYVVFSRSSLAEIRRYGVPTTRLHVIPNGVELPIRDEVGLTGGVEELRSQLGVGQRPLVGFVGRLHSDKDPLLFVRAAERIARSHPEVRFVMDGDGPMRQQVEAAIKACDLAESIILPGWSADIFALISALDVFVISSRTEGMPTVLIEAMALGVPVVSTAVGSVPEMIEDGVDGLLVNTGDDAQIAAAVENLITDPTKAIRMARAARETCYRRYDFAQIARRVEDAYGASGL